MEINKVLHDPIIKMAQVNHLPDKLGLNDIARLLFYHRYEAAASDVGWFMEVLASGEFIGWVNKQIESGRIPIDGRTNRKLPLWFRDNVMEPILSRDTVKILLDIIDLFPLEEGCLLANWWTDERTDETGNQDNGDRGGETADGKKAGYPDRLRTEHAKTYVINNNYMGGDYDEVILGKLQSEEPELWPSMATFRKWIRLEEAKLLFPNNRRKPK